LLDRLKTLFGGSARPAPPGGSSAASSSSIATGPPVSRQSNGMDQFFGAIRDRSGLNLLDFAGASQENISFITSMGHRLSSEDFVRAIDHTFGTENVIEAQSDPLRLDEFVRENLGFPADSFDGALVWDALQFLSPHLLQLTVDRLYETLRPGAYILAFFNADEKARHVPVYHYRILDHKTLLLTPRGYRQAIGFFNNRAIEKLFHRFDSVKFFLARDNLREIIVKR
jgi:hypothetical protein